MSATLQAALRIGQVPTNLWGTNLSVSGPPRADWVSGVLLTYTRLLALLEP